MSERTLADVPELMRSCRVHREPHARFDPSLRTTEVFAPCCGRRTPANTIFDVRTVPGTVVRGGGHQVARDHDWLCDGCAHRMIIDPSNLWQLSSLLEACGAHPDDVRHHRIREHARSLERADHAAGRPHQPEQAWRTAEAHISQPTDSTDVNTRGTP